MIAHPDPGNNAGGMEASVDGTVSIDSDCLCLVGDVERYPVIWPNGSLWSAGESSVVLANGTSVAVGEDITGAGGHLRADFLEQSMSEDVVARAAACVDDTYGEIAVINNAAGDVWPAKGSRYVVTLTFEPGDLFYSRGMCWTVTTPDGVSRGLASSSWPVEASARVIGTYDADGTPYVCPLPAIIGPGTAYLRFVTATDLGDEPEVAVCQMGGSDRCINTNAEWDP